MKLSSVLFALLFAAVCVVPTVVLAQEEDAGGGVPDEPAVPNHDPCDAICHERHAALVREKDELWHSREAVIREKDELWHSREAVIREKDELWHSREAVIREKEELVQQHRNLQDAAGNVDELRSSLQAKESELELKTKEMEHYQKVARDNQKYMQEYKDQLATQRHRSHQLNTALEEARAKIEELENTTFFAKLRNELSTGWGAVVQYWNNLKEKGEKEL